MITREAAGARTEGETRRRPRILLAGVAALISGVAVFVNGEGVKRFPSATVYTTAKNLIAVAILLLAWTLTAGVRPAHVLPVRRLRPGQRAGVVLVGIFGGGVAFVLFFEGLTTVSATQAAFVQKTLVVWVGLLAVPLLRERLSGLHVAAIGMLIAGQLTLGRGPSGFRAGRGQALILGATLLWAAEVIVAKRLLRAVPSLTLGVARLGIGVVVLAGWLAVRGRASELTGLGASGWWWATLTGVLLAGYVTCWFAALARAQAVDVTAVLVGAALVTAVLNSVAHGTALAPDGTGLALIAAGIVLMAVAATRPAPPPLASP